MCLKFYVLQNLEELTMRFLAPFLGPICYALAVISLVLALLFRNNQIHVVGLLLVCAAICFFLGYTIHKQNKEETMYNFFPNRIQTEDTVYSMHLRLDNTAIIGYNGVPELKSATELNIRQEDNKYYVYKDNQKLGYIPEDCNAYYLTKNSINDPTCLLKAFVRKDGDKTFDIACYQE